MQTQKLKIKYLMPDKDVKLSLNEEETFLLLNLIQRSNEMTHEMITDKENVDSEWKEMLAEDLGFGVHISQKIQRAAALAGLEME